MGLFDNTPSEDGGSAYVISQQDDTKAITWRNGMADIAEMMKISGEATEEQGIQAGLARANLNVSNGKVNMMSVLQVPWHGLGTVINQAATSAEALRFAGLAGWDLEKIQAYVDVTDHSGQAKHLPTNRYGIVRRDTGKILGVVGSRYTVFSNEQCFDFMDAVVGEGGARFETAGAIGDGERVWMLAKMPVTAEVAEGDTLEPYIMFGTSHDGSSSVWCFPTSVRTVCANTYRLAMLGRKSGLNIRHTQNIDSKIDQARKVLGLAVRTHDNFVLTARQLARTPLHSPVDYFNAALNTIVDVAVAGVTVDAANIDSTELLKAILSIEDPDERRDEEARLETVKSRRKELMADMLERFESDRCNGKPSIAGSMWAAVNAVTESVDHSPLYTYRGSPQVRRESRFMSIMDGRASEITNAAISLALNLSL